MGRLTAERVRREFYDQLTEVATDLNVQAKRIADMMAAGTLPDTGLPSKNVDGAVLAIQKLQKLVIDIDAKLQLAEKGLLSKLEQTNERQQRFRENQKKKLETKDEPDKRDKKKR